MTGANCFSYGWLGILGLYSAAGTFWGLAHLGWGWITGSVHLPLKGVYFSSLCPRAISSFCKCPFLPPGLLSRGAPCGRCFAAFSVPARHWVWFTWFALGRDSACGIFVVWEGVIRKDHQKALGKLLLLIVTPFLAYKTRGVDRWYVSSHPPLRAHHGLWSLLLGYLEKVNRPGWLTV